MRKSKPRLTAFQKALLKELAETRRYIAIGTQRYVDEQRLNRDRVSFLEDQLERIGQRSYDSTIRVARAVENFSVSPIVMAIERASRKPPNFFERICNQVRIFFWNWKAKRQTKHTINLKEEADKLAAQNPGGRWA